jgi:hypothetical protein
MLILSYEQEYIRDVILSYDKQFSTKMYPLMVYSYDNDNYIISCGYNNSIIIPKHNFQ